MNGARHYGIFLIVPQFLLMRICLALLAFVSFIAFAVVAACEFSSKFCFSMSSFRGILIAAPFVIFLRHLSSLLSAQG